ncbi:MAG: tryptophan-rich sensory protein [Parachlamydiaceae bacterium]|nr:MAG: tryptophan-rich sensory protein [Parachlamydiaceae bacterium]
MVTQQGIRDWYDHLIHPPGTPPNFVFPIVWTILYTLMAISLALILSSSEQNKKIPLVFFALQLIFNFSWSWLFFGMRSPGLALVDLGLLWLCIFGTIMTFWQYSRMSSYLLFPYLGWVTYAAYLNLFIWINNP